MPHFVVGQDPFIGAGPGVVVVKGEVLLVGDDRLEIAETDISVFQIRLDRGERGVRIRALHVGVTHHHHADVSQGFLR